MLDFCYSMFRGKFLKDMDREELYKVIEYLSKENTKLNSQFFDYRQDTMDMLIDKRRFDLLNR